MVAEGVNGVDPARKEIIFLGFSLDARAKVLVADERKRDETPSPDHY